MATIQNVEIAPGARVSVKDAFGSYLDRRAVSSVTQGHAFAVVWVCREQEWELAKSEGRDPDAVPWPAEDVTPVEPAATEAIS